MILVDKQIKAMIQCRKISIDPFDAGCVNPNSYDLHLGPGFMAAARTGYIDPYSRDTITRAFYERNTNEIIINPYDFVLGRTEETITLPADIVGLVEGKSSLARLGLSIHQTGGWIDAGFSGTITLEFYNCSPNPIILTAGMPIAQIVFFQTAESETPYGTRGTSKYQNQMAATLSRYYKNRRV